MASSNNTQIKDERVLENDDDEENVSASLAMSLLSSSTIHVVLKAVLELDILEIIKKVGHNSSAKEIVAHLPAKNPDAVSMIDRMLRLLASQSVLTCTIRSLPNGLVERFYGLTPVCKFLTKDENGVSLAPLDHINNRVIGSGYELKDAILEGGHPFERAYNMSQLEYNAQNPDVTQKFNAAMACHSKLTMDKILKIYKGFEGLSSLVDVGGGNGATLNVILSKYPTIKGINFDLTFVINFASPCPGVEHVGGDMFESIPKGDAIFLKWVCHMWSDEECIKLLKKCYEAIPEHGKVIVCEFIIPENIDSSICSKSALQLDAVMMLMSNTSKERTEKEFHSLAMAAGFQVFKVACSALDIKVMEFLKRNH